jgi:hypothetical protein
MSQKQGSDWAAGWISFAGFMMILLGSFHAVAGLVGIIDDQFYVSTQKYIFQFDRTTWGWIHLLVGIIVVLAGFGVFSGALWARIVGVILAVVSAIAAFAWLPYYPIWGIAIIVVAIAVIWALTMHGREVERLQE